MTFNKKKFTKILISVIALILCAALAFGGYVLYRFNCDKSKATHSYSEIYSRQQAVLDVDNSGIFKILKINDTHFFNGTCDNDAKTLDGIKNLLENNTYDLIIVNGDLVDGFNLRTDYDKYGAIKLFAEMIEASNTPWTFAPGNNDGEIDGENEDVIAYMMQYAHFICNNTEGVNGAMQVFIDLNFKGKTAHSVAVLDSGSRTIKAIGKYEFIKKSQAKWLVDGVNERNVKTSVFCHMQTNAFQEAFDNGEAYKEFYMSNVYPYDDIEKDTILDEMIKDNTNITLLSCAHQHSNNMCSFYNGRYYQLSSAGGYSAGRNDIIDPSVTEILIDVTDDNAKTMYTFNQIKI